MATRLAGLTLSLLLLSLASGCAERSSAEPAPPAPDRDQQFDQLVARYADLTFKQLSDEAPQRD